MFFQKWFCPPDTPALKLAPKPAPELTVRRSSTRTVCVDIAKDDVKEVLLKWLSDKGHDIPDSDPAMHLYDGLIYGNAHISFTWTDEGNPR